MSRLFFTFAILLLLGLIQVTTQARKQSSAVISNIDNIKELKKLLRTKTNVLILFLNVPKASQSALDVVKDTADIMKGQATLVIIDCSGSNSDSKKLCKKLKIPSENPFYIRHYKDGEFHKDYDRSVSVSSMTNFLRDPTGDLPWEEDPNATDVYHLQDGEALVKFLRKGAAAYKKSMIMFYAPWCGYCKILKPEYVQAAGDLKEEALLAAIDVSKPENTKIRQVYNITGFPTLLYYEKGQLRYPYNGDNKKQAIVDFMRDPTSQMQKKKPEPAEESWSKDSDVVHLTAENFDSTLAREEHALVVFYAPWCGHCKRIKPEFEKAASKIKQEKISGILAAVDATQEGSLASRFGVKGYPTLKYFNKGEYKYDAGHARQEEQIINFIKDPQEPPPPPPPEKPWSEEDSFVRHLDASSFKPTLRKVKHAVVMFYAPWCGHCKSTKPEFVKAAEVFSEDLMVVFGAVDCTVEKEVCSAYDVTGYPTIKYFSHYDKVVREYTGGRKEADFVSFIRTEMGEAPLPSDSTKEQEAGFSTDVIVATDENLEKVISAPKYSFVMFHATWCGHCVAAKPAFSKLATVLKNDKSPVQVVAVEASINKKAASVGNVRGFPTFKVFYKGKLVTDYDGDRSLEDMHKYCKNLEKRKDEL